MHSHLIGAFLRWTLLHTALARGWWMVTAIYLVTVAELSPGQLILIGVFQGITVVIAEIPAGVLADAVSRRLALVLSHVVMGAGMAMTGLVSAFPLLVISNCMWGLGWALASGSDVAWITDELDRPDLIDRVLTQQAQRKLLGSAVGIVTVGALAWSAGLAVAIVTAGALMIAVGLLLVARWPENRFGPVAAGRRWREGSDILRRGVALARADRMVLLVLAATVVINGGAEGFGRLYERRFIDLGIPTRVDPILWFAAVALVAVALGAVALRLVQERLDGTRTARRVYVGACGVGGVGLLLFAAAPNAAAAVPATLLVSGIALPATRLTGTIIVNRQATSEVRATVHSMLSEAENFGEIIFGLGLALVATAGSGPTVLTGSAALFACAGAIVHRTRHHDHPRP